MSRDKTTALSAVQSFHGEATICTNEVVELDDSTLSQLVDSLERHSGNKVSPVLQPPVGAVIVGQQFVPVSRKRLREELVCDSQICVYGHVTDAQDWEEDVAYPKDPEKEFRDALESLPKKVPRLDWDSFQFSTWKDRVDYDLEVLVSKMQANFLDPELPRDAMALYGTWKMFLNALEMLKKLEKLN